MTVIPGCLRFELPYLNVNMLPNVSFMTPFAGLRVSKRLNVLLRYAWEGALKKSRNLLLIGTSLLTFAIASSDAMSQSVRPDFFAGGDVISFGDSLSDNGNVFTLSGGLSPDPAVFQGGNRFVNPGGLTWIEQLLGGTPNTDGTDATSPQAVFFATGTVTGDVSVAVGGAFAGSGNLGPGLPGVTQQLGAFAGAGGTISAEDTVTYWTGANNFFAGLPTVTSAAGAGALGQSVGALAVNDITQISTGAVIPGGGPGQLIYVTLPNLAVLPATNAGAQAAGAAAAGAVLASGGTPEQAQAAAAQAGAAVLSGAAIAIGAYNQTLVGGVNQLAAVDTDTDFVLLDAASVFDAVVANPAAFGFTNVSDACLLTPSCATADFATQNTFLFADGVHPTNAGYALLAELARQTLDPTAGGATASGLAEGAFQSREFVAYQALGRARSYFLHSELPGVASSADLDPQSETPVGSSHRGGAFVEAIAGTARIGARGVTPEVSTDLYGLRLGADLHQSESLVFGAQGSFTTGNGSQPQLEFEPSSFAVDLYAAKTFGAVYAALTAGAASLDVANIERSVGVGGLVNTGDTSGSQFNVIGELGYKIAFGDYSIIPSGSVGYFRTNIDGYTEDGLFAPLSFGDRDVDAVTGSVNLRAARGFAIESGYQGRIFAGIGYEDFLTYNANDLNVAALASTAAASAISIDDPDGRGFLFELGAEVVLDDTFSLAADYTLGIGGSDTQSHQGALRLITKF